MARRVFLVVILSLLSIALWAPDAPRAFGHPHGELSYRVAADGRIAPGRGSNNATRYIDLANTPLTGRLRLLRNGACWQPSPGDLCERSFFKDGREYRLVNPALPEPPSNAPAVLARIVLGFLWLAAGATLVLLRPSATTWAFFVLSLNGWTPNNIAGEIGPPAVQLVMTSFIQLWEMAIPFAAPVFALYLLQPHLVGWRRNALIATSALTAIVCIVEIAAFLVVAVGARGWPGPFFAITTPYVEIAPTWIATSFLLVTYFDSAREQRQRIRWVLLGFALGSVALSLQTEALQYSYAAYSAAQAAYVFFITASTAYAILKHRIVDVNVVLSRTLVYTLLSAIVVGIFALVDLFFSRVLAENKEGLMADVGLALVLGFFMNSMHHRVDHFVDGILFRKRHLAEKHIELVTHSLRHAAQEHIVDRMLVAEPVRAFDLAFSALAHTCGEDEMKIAYASLPEMEGREIKDTDSLAAYLSSERKALFLRKHFWQSGALRSNAAEASVAIPVFSHGELDAIVFYAPHRNGTELDGEEIALLERLADAAGAAYDRLEAKALRDRLEQMSLAPAT